MDNYKRIKIGKLLSVLRREYKKWNAPIVTLIASHNGTPLEILLSTILSLRTKDETTAKACKKLCGKVKTIEDILKLSEKEIEKLIYL